MAFGGFFYFLLQVSINLKNPVLPVKRIFHFSVECVDIFESTDRAGGTCS
uniref:Uncharacterized protein n=1 Tax=Anguilla anguilla TaxID=7936 RepID=A0A0E9RVW4_ANGAN